MLRLKRAADAMRIFPLFTMNIHLKKVPFLF